MLKMGKAKKEKTVGNKVKEPKVKKKETKKDKVLKAPGKKKVMLGVGTKIILGFVVPVICIVLLGTISYKKSSESLIAAYERSTDQSLGAVSNYLAYGFDTIVATASECMTDETLKDYASKMQYKADSPEYVKAGEAIDSYLKLKISCNQLIETITVVPAAGFATKTTVRAEETDGFFEELMADERLNLATMDGVWAGEHAMVDEKMGILADSYACTYYKRFPGMKAALFIDVDAEKIAEVMGDMEYGEGSMQAIILPDGTELHYGKSLPAEGNYFQSLSCYQEVIQTGSTEGHVYIEQGGEEYLFVYSGLENGTMVCAMVPKADIIKEANAIRGTTVIFVAVAGVLAVLIGGYLSLSIGRVIKKLSRRLEKVAKGDLTVDFEVKGNDEFALLSASIKDTIAHVHGLIGKVADISAQLQNNAENVVHYSADMGEMAQQINDSMTQVATTVEMEAKDAQSCVEDMEVLSEKIVAVNENVVNIKEFANKTGEMVREDIDTMNALNEKTDKVREVMGTLFDDIRKLEDKSKAVDGFVQIIDSIAGQTNLLSLNASIEAARAGAAGRGFAVVAEEIRKLSEESASAANEIRKAAADITDQTKATVGNVRTADGIVEEQNKTVDELIQAFEGLYAEMNALLVKVEDISVGMEDMSAARITTLDSISNISASTEETYSLSVTVGDLVRQHGETSKGLDKVSEDLQDKAAELNEAVHQFVI